MTKANIIKQIKLLGKQYGVKIIFSYNIRYGGWANLRTEVVTISTRLKLITMISVACHEISHILNKREGKYPIYHNWKNWMNLKTRNKVIATAHRAEMYTEKRGRALMKKHYPKYKYRQTYFNTKRSKAWLKEQLA
jgi:hypothetical protein